MSEYIGWVDYDWNVILDHNQPIVRCRDCLDYIPPVDGVVSSVCCHFEMPGVEPDGFCAWGERRPE